MKRERKRLNNLVEAIKVRNSNINNDVNLDKDIDFLVWWQADRLIEECSELIQAMSKVKRYGFVKDRMQNLHEEASHVYICTRIMMGLIGDNEQFNEELDKKLTQLEKSYSNELNPGDDSGEITDTTKRDSYAGKD